MNVGPTSRAPGPPPRSAIATRVLASFGVTVLAFAITVGWSVVAQRRTAQDSEERLFFVFVRAARDNDRSVGRCETESLVHLASLDFDV